MHFILPAVGGEVPFGDRFPLPEKEKPMKVYFPLLAGIQKAQDPVGVHAGFGGSDCGKMTGLTQHTHTLFQSLPLL